MRLTEENYVELAEKAMRDICDERDKKRQKGATCYNFKNQESSGNDGGHLQ